MNRKKCKSIKNLHKSCRIHTKMLYTVDVCFQNKYLFGHSAKSGNKGITSTGRMLRFLGCLTTAHTEGHTHTERDRERAHALKNNERRQYEHASGTDIHNTFL